MSVRTVILLFIALAAAAALGWGFIWNEGDWPPARAAVAPILPVLVGQADTRDVPIWLTGIGSVQSLHVVVIKPRIDGQLESVAFTEGQELHVGDVLAQIDPRMYQAALDQALAKRAQDFANLANARIDLTRYQKLAASNYISAQQAETQKALVAEREALVRQDEAAADMARLQRDFTTIRAPLDGRAGLRLVDPGSIVHASDPNGIVAITQMAPIGAMFPVSQDDLPDVVTAIANGDVTVTAYSRDDTSLLATGRLVFVDSQVDQTTGQVKLKAVFDNARRELWPGQLINARVLLRTIPQAVVVPTKSIEHGRDGTYVFKVLPDDTVAVQPVTIGPFMESVTVVTDGVVSGDRIVISGQYRLRPGVRIAPRRESTPTPFTPTQDDGHAR